ncbi:tRNA (N6-threonylcarbamoyladenosine(37)-N6)-methyltransferase TrmO [Aliiruegeria sabulilitoris]|uniref:tRNA (N6-threonylcarbamoyladenosine(37)-N6)-methyltransferase TrmO n=1 Tax=Aliiruegeria sabulilitoris TaxID=1510458 RepID=UPI00082BA0EB|nr:tRNA (N6-threonylcarbamoyladenosine(37)-N6)-methyltransferase TrmO [Aliiruegeria sabulilitoris]NDR58168.1 tRNA (N6-threonylcarbamoyladenosine(37)-N6)-methyltransferase TrmO [Pseudoruegeria sp. M32A2M]
MTDKTEIRDGERLLDFDPAQRTEAGVAFIGHIRSPWTARAECPRNISTAREDGRGARIVLREGYAEGLAGLEAGRHLMVLYWMDRARRDLIVQNPRHTEAPRGTFALRSPNRPNPIAMSAVTIRSIDLASGEIEIDAIDCLDGTPVVDLKPWLPGIDIPAGVSVREEA